MCARVSSVKQEMGFDSVEIRPMHELDVPVIVAIERTAYQFPWSEGIFAIACGSVTYAGWPMSAAKWRATASCPSERARRTS